MNITGHDILEYTLEELHEAFEGVNDQKYPKRAVQLYLRIQELEESERLQNKEHTLLELLRDLTPGLFMLPKLALLEARIFQDELEEKIQRVKHLISQGTHSG